MVEGMHLQTMSVETKEPTSPLRPLRTNIDNDFLK
jgi:hypothetical protein